MTTAQTDLRFPTGRFKRPEALTADQRREAIDMIAGTPARLRAAVAGLTEAQLDTPYRPGGWSVRQVVHHLPDSHMNAYVRFKLALTEDTPRVKAYDEARWAMTAEARSAPVEVSLALLEALHERWVRLLRSLSDDDFARALDHPENGRMRLDTVLAMYAWHGPHHVAHITGLREREGW
jgi:uncharacterized damage-inducible protein DinB